MPTAQSAGLAYFRFPDCMERAYIFEILWSYSDDKVEVERRTVGMILIHVCTIYMRMNL